MAWQQRNGVIAMAARRGIGNRGVSSKVSHHQAANGVSG